MNDSGSINYCRYLIYRGKTMKFPICILMYLLAIGNVFRAIGKRDDEGNWCLLWAWFSGFQFAAGFVLTLQLAGII
jgi:hypothetical protein